MDNREVTKERSITLNDIVRAFKRGWIILVIITIAVTIIGAIYTFGIAKPKYKATASVKVEVPLTSESSNDVGNSVTAALRYVNSVASLVSLDPVVSAVADANKDIITKEALVKQISTSASDKSIFVSITVTNGNKKNAATLASALAKEVEKYSKDSTDTSISDEYRFLCTIVAVDLPQEGSYASPNKTLYLIISVLAGVVLGAVVIFVKEFASNKFKTKEEIEELGLPVTGVLIDDKEYIENPDTLVKNDLTSYEPYNKIFNNIKYSNFDKDLKKIMITSTGSDELKSSVISNIACAIAFNGKKVVLVDLDTRKPSLHKMFNIEKKNGIIDLLDQTITKEKAIKHTDRNVDVITVDKHVTNPVVVLESEALKNLIDELAKEYDYVLIDTPPLIACSDAKIVSKYADGVLFNVAMNQYRRGEVKESINSLKSAEANIIGINITKFKGAGKSDYYYYYNYKNYYSDTATENNE